MAIREVFRTPIAREPRPSNGNSVYPALRDETYAVIRVESHNKWHRMVF